MSFPKKEYENESSEDWQYESNEDAIFALYEQLFLSSSKIDPQSILGAMKYLIFEHSMQEQMEEIQFMQACDLEVEHKKVADHKVEEMYQEVKEKLYNILEENII